MTDEEEESRSETHLFLRSIGLHLLVPIFAFFSKKEKRAEEPKCIIRSSRSAAAATALVHLVPVLASIAVVTLNLKQLYLGLTVPGPIRDSSIMNAIFQLIAKLHELFIMASLSTVIFGVIRQELVSKRGVPLSFLFIYVSTIDVYM